MKTLSRYVITRNLLAITMPLLLAVALAANSIMTHNTESHGLWLKSTNAIIHSKIDGFFNQKSISLKTLASVPGFKNSGISGDALTDDYEDFIQDFIESQDFKFLFYCDALGQIKASGFSEESTLSLSERQQLYSNFSDFVTSLSASDREVGLGVHVIEFDNHIIPIAYFFDEEHDYIVAGGLKPQTLSELLLSDTHSSQNVESYLVLNQNTSFRFLTDVIYGGMTFDQGDSPEQIPDYWHAARVSRTTSNPARYKDRQGNFSFVSYANIGISSGQSISVISLVEESYIMSPIIDTVQYLATFIVAAMLLFYLLMHRLGRKLRSYTDGVIDYVENIGNESNKLPDEMLKFREFVEFSSNLEEIGEKLHRNRRISNYELVLERDVREVESLKNFSRKLEKSLRKSMNTSCLSLYRHNSSKASFELVYKSLCNHCDFIIEGEGKDIVQFAFLNEEIVQTNKLSSIVGDVEPNQHYQVVVPIKGSDADVVIILTVEQKLDRKNLKYLATLSRQLSKLIQYTVKKEDLSKALAKLKRNEAQLSDANAKLKVLSIRDSLTQCFNKTYGSVEGNNLFTSAKVNEQDFTVMFVDIDHFKGFNDHYGHLRGDSCLKEVAGKIQSICRSSDLLYRFGGEEFVLCLPKTNFEGAKVVAEKVRRMVSELNIKHAASKVSDRVTVSVGSCTVTNLSLSTATFEGTLDAADNALYVAKKQRNKTNCVLAD